MIVILVFALALCSCGPASENSDQASSSSEKQFSPTTGDASTISEDQSFSFITEGSKFSDRIGAPSIFAFDTKNMRIAWSDSLEDDASIVSIFGAPEIQNNIPYARGHVSFIYKGIPILITGGNPVESSSLETAVQGDPSMYNILQLNEVPLLKPASINVRNLDTKGGNLRVNPTLCYKDLAHWHRDVNWSDTEMRISDDINFKLGKRYPISLNWNLGTDEEVKITQSESFYFISWSNISMDIQSSQPIRINQVNRTAFNAPGIKDNTCTALIIEVEEIVPAIRIVTRVRLQKSLMR